MAGVDSENAIADDDSKFGESETEDEFAQSQESQEQTNGRASDDEEDMTPWEGAKCTKDRNEEATTRGPGARHRNGHISANRTTVDRSDNNQHNAGGPMDIMGARTDRPQIEEFSDAKHGAHDSGVAKRKAKIDARHRWRNNKRAREGVNTATIGRYEIQRELQLIVGNGTSTPTNAGAVPWEHRGLLGQTGRRRNEDDDCWNGDDP